MNKKIQILLLCIALFLMSIQSNVQCAETNLSQVFKLVLENNPDVKSNLATIMSAQGESIQAGLGPNPEVTLELEDIGGEENFLSLDGSEITLSIEQEIEIAGKRRHQIDIAKYNLKVVKQEAISNISIILVNTHQRYASFIVAKERLRLSEKRLELADKIHKAVRKRVEVAAASEIQSIKVDIEQKSASIEKSKAEENFSSTKIQLERILSASSYQINEEEIISSLYIDLPSKKQLMESLDTLPQADIVKLKELKARSNVQLAISDKISNPTLGFGISRSNETDDNTFLLTFSMPISIFNSNQGNIVMARAEQMRVKNEAKSTSLSIKETAETVYGQLVTSAKEITSYREDIIPSAQKLYKQTSDGYSLGRFSLLELLDAQRTLYEVQEDNLNSLLNFHNAKAQIDLLMGTHKDIIKRTISLKKGH